MSVKRNQRYTADLSLSFRDDDPKCAITHPIRRGLSTSRSYFGRCPDPQGESPTADPLLRGGPTPFALWQGTIYSLIESDLWSCLVSALETSLDRGVSSAEGLVCGLRGLAFPTPRPRCVCESSHHAAGRLDPQTAASSFNTFLSAVENFWSLSGRVHLTCHTTPQRRHPPRGQAR